MNPADNLTPINYLSQMPGKSQGACIENPSTQRTCEKARATIFDAYRLTILQVRSLTGSSSALSLQATPFIYQMML